MTAPIGSFLDDGLWLSISDIAREKGRDKSLISRKVTELEKEGRIETRDGPNKTKLVNLAQFDAAWGETTDLIKEQGAATAREEEDDAGGSSGFHEARARSARYDADRKEIELRQLGGSLIEIDQVQRVIEEVGEEIKKPLDQIPLRAEEINAAAASGGVAAVRAKLKEAVLAVRTQIADALGKLDIRSRPSGGVS